MRLILTLLCRNEADIIQAVVEYHLARGVDFIIATDNGSTDGTAEILSSYASTGCLHLLHESSHTHDQAAWVSRMAELALQQYGADWLIHCDADEFWWPQSASLKDDLAAVGEGITALEVQRFNFLPPPLETTPDVPFYHAQLIREIRSLNNLGRPLPPKVCHRARLGAWIGDGNHKLLIDGQRISAQPFSSIEILHFPVRSLSQFERKIQLGAEALARNPRLSADVGKTWRIFHESLLQKGSLADDYLQLRVGLDCNNRCADTPGLMVDTRLRDALMPILG